MIKSEFLINEKNVFALPIKEYAIFSEILNQVESQLANKNIDSMDKLYNNYIDFNIGENSIKNNLNSLYKLSKNKRVVTQINYSNNIPLFSLFNLLKDWLLLKIKINEHIPFYDLKKYKREFDNLVKTNSNFYVDFDEKDFIQNELENCHLMLKELEKEIYNEPIPVNYRPGLLDNSFKSSITRVLNKRVSFLEEKIGTTENENLQLTKKQTNNKIQWNGSQTEFIELVKALVESQSITGSQKDIVDELSSFLSIEIKYPNKLIQDIKNRNNDMETKFLDKLKTNLIKFISN